MNTLLQLLMLLALAPLIPNAGSPDQAFITCNLMSVVAIIVASTASTYHFMKAQQNREYPVAGSLWGVALLGAVAIQFYA